MLAEIGGNAFGVGTDTSGKEEEEGEEEGHSRVVKPHYLASPDSNPSVRDHISHAECPNGRVYGKQRRTCRPTRSRTAAVIVMPRQSSAEPTNTSRNKFLHLGK